MPARSNDRQSHCVSLTPDSLRKDGVAAYALTESCRRHDGARPRGITEPWTALCTDLMDLGAITGHADRAAEVNADLDRRLAAGTAAP